MTKRDNPIYAPWTDHTGPSLCVPIDDLGTAQLIPQRFRSAALIQPAETYLMYDLRRTPDGALDPGFPLNTAKASILITGRNFGHGTNPELATFILRSAGIRALIAPSFNEKFITAAANNGLLTAVITQGDTTSLRAETAPEITVDLTWRVLTRGPLKIPFHIDDVCALKLANGLDDIDMALHFSRQIKAYAHAVRIDSPWRIARRRAVATQAPEPPDVQNSYLNNRAAARDRFKPRGSHSGADDN